MDNSYEGTHLINVVLTKINGLYQILNPKTVKYYGYNVYHIIIILLILIQAAISIVMLMCCVYYWPNNLIDSILYLGVAENILYSCYNIFIIVYHSRDLLNCLSITRLDFTSYGRRGERVLGIWRNRSIEYTSFLTCMTFGGLIYYLMCPFINGDTFLKMENRDGSIGYYHLNIVDLFFVPDETYNKYFIIYFTFESLYVIIFLIFVNIYDTIFITLTLALSCQFQVINTAFELVGREQCFPNRLFSCECVGKDLTDGLDVHEDLINLIKGHQAIIKKFEEFLTIFQWPILFQIFVSSTTHIIVYIIPTMSIIDGEFSEYGPKSTKVLISLPMQAFEIFMMCYLCGTIHHQKDALIFSLYSNNWTQMDLKCKHLILLTMKVNNSHRLKIKFTPTAIVDLELFFKTMRVCYSIFSMLVNYNKSVRH